MGGFRHYLPAASGPEQDLLAALAREHPEGLVLHVRPLQETAQIFFEVESLAMAGWIWFLLGRLRRRQRHLDGQWRMVDPERQERGSAA